MASTSGRVGKNRKQGMGGGVKASDKNTSPLVKTKPASAHGMKHHSPTLMR